MKVNGLTPRSTDILCADQEIVHVKISCIHGIHHSMQEGELDVTVESSSFTIYPGDCILVNANVVHSTKCVVPNKAIVLQIPLDFMEKYIPDVQQFMFIWDYQTKDPVKKTKLDMLKTTLEQLQIIDDIRPDGFILRFNSLIFELLFQLYHNFGVKIFQSDLSQQKKDLDRLNLVLNYISENYRYPISLDEIAGVAYLQAGYFCRFFKKKMGVHFWNIRMNTDFLLSTKI